MNHGSKESGVTHDIKPAADRPFADPPVLSQIACLGGPVDESEEINIPRNSLQRKDETSFVRLCREGGHKGLLQMEEQTQKSEPVDYERNGAKSGNTLTGRSNIRDTDSEFVRLSKQGGHEGLLKIDSGGGNDSPYANTQQRYLRKGERLSPSNCPPAGTKPADVNIVPGNPIWLGGSGPEMGFVPGKRFMKKENKESPFAVSSDWMGTQSRNPDKI